MGNKYLVIVDRFSNWISVHTIKTGAGAYTLVKMHWTFFLTYGVSSELASDGGLEFVSSTTQKWWTEIYRDKGGAKVQINIFKL